MFKMLLKFLRTGKLVEGLSRRELLELQAEAEYFQITSLLEIINQRLDVLRFVIVKLDSINEEEGKRRLVVAKRSWFGAIPVHVIVKILEMDYPMFGSSFRNVIATDLEDYAVDADGNIIVYTPSPSRIIDTIHEMERKMYQGVYSKALIYLRDCYYDKETDQVELNIGNQKYMCKKSALVYANVSIIHENGQFDIKTPKICPNQRSECPMYRTYHNQPHETSLEDLLKRILTRLDNNRVGQVKPPERSELWEDYCAAVSMNLFSSPSNWFC